MEQIITFFYNLGVTIGTTVRRLMQPTADAVPVPEIDPETVTPEMYAAWYKRKYWKTHIEPGVIGSKDHFWPVGRGIMSDSTDDPGEIVESCHAAVIPLVQQVFSQTGRAPDAINVVRNVWTGNRCVHVPIVFKVRTTDDPGKFILEVSPDQQQRLQTMPMAVKSFLN